MRRTTICVLGLMLAFGGMVQAQDLDEVLANYYEAMGGLDKIKSVDTVAMKGRVDMGQGVMAPVTLTQARGGKLRIEFEVQGMVGVQAFDGEVGWMYFPFMGQAAPELMPEDMKNATARQADIDGPLVDSADKGIELALIGREDVEGTEAFHIEVAHPDGTVDQYFLDSEYYIPIQMKSTTKMQGQEMETTTTLGDYKEIEGVLFAHSIIQSGAMGANIVLDEIMVNTEVDDSIFAMPEVEEAVGAPAEG